MIEYPKQRQRDHLIVIGSPEGSWKLYSEIAAACSLAACGIGWWTWRRSS